MTSFASRAAILSIVLLLFAGLASAVSYNVTLNTPTNSTTASPVVLSGHTGFTGMVSANNASKSVTVSFNYTDFGEADLVLTNASLWANFTGAWANNESNNSALSAVNVSQFNMANVAGIGEGFYIWAVNVTNLTGQFNMSGNFSFFVDFTPPISNIVTGGTNNSNSSVNYLFVNATVNDTRTKISACIFSNVSSGLNLSSSSTDASSANSSCSKNYTSLADGLYNYTVNFNDSGNNFNNTSTISFRIDTTLPNAINTAAPAKVNNSNTSSTTVAVNYTFTEVNPANCTLQFGYGNGTTTNTTITPTTSSICDFGNIANAFNASGQAANFSVTVMDGSSNSNVSSLAIINFDNITPTTFARVSPSLVNSSNTSNNFVFVNMSFNELNPANCTLQYGNQTGTQNYTMPIVGTGANAYCALNVTNNFTATNQNNNYTVFVSDFASNTNSSGLFTIHFENTTPNSVNPASPTTLNNMNVSSNTISVNYTFVESNAANCTLQFSYNNGTTTNTTITPSPGSYCQFANIANASQTNGGVFNYTVFVMNGVSNSNSSSLVNLRFLNVSPSGITGVAPTLATNANTSSNTIVANYTFTDANGAANCTLQFSYNNGTTTNTTVVPIAPNTCQFVNTANASQVSNTPFNYTVWVTDGAGNFNSSFVSLRFQNTTPSQVNITSPSTLNNMNVSGNTVSVNFTFNDPNAANCTLQFTYQNSTTTNTTINPSSGSYCQFANTANASLVNGGVFNYTVWVANGAGFINSSSQVNLRFLNVSPSGITGVAPTLATNANTSSNTIVANYTFTDANGAANCTLQFSYNNGTTTNTTVVPIAPNTCQFVNTANASQVSNTPFNYTVWVTDGAGNFNSSFVSLRFQNTTPNSIVLAAPTLANNANTTSNTVAVNFTFTEPNAANCTLQFNYANGTTTNTTINPSSGNYCQFANVANASQVAGLNFNYTVWVANGAGFINASAFDNVLFDNATPNAIAFALPSVNNSNTSKTWVFVNVTFTSNAPANCTLQYNNGTSNANYSMSLVGTGSKSYCFLNVTNNFTTAGQIANFTAFMSSGAGLTNSTSIWTALFDNTSPSVTLSTPLDTSTATSTPAFNFTYADDFTSGSCFVYLDGSIASTGLGITGAASLTASSISPGAHTWFVNCLDGSGNSINSTSRTFSVSSTSGSTSSTPAAVVAPAPAPSSSSGISSGVSGPIGGGASQPAPAPVAQTVTLGASSDVSGTFSGTSSSFDVTYTAPSGGFNGQVTYHMPLDYADYQAGLITISPQPSSVKPGSIYATWDVALAPKETFTAKVDVAKKLDPSILNSFKAPSVVAANSAQPSAPAAGTPAPTAMAPKPSPSPASSDYTLWYVVGALVILGALYYVFVGGKKKPKGL